MRGCKYPLGFSKAESKQSEPQVHLASFCSLLLPGLSPVPLTSAPCCPHQCHPQPVPFPLSHLPWVCPPTCLQAQFLPGLATLLTESAHLASNHVVQVSHSIFAPTLSSQPFFISTSSFLLMLWVHQSRVSSQIGRHQAGFIPEAANLGPTGQIWLQICFVWLHYAFEN